MSLEPLREALASATVRPNIMAEELVDAIAAATEEPGYHPSCVTATSAALLGYRSRQGEVDRLWEALEGLLATCIYAPASGAALAKLAKEGSKGACAHAAATIKAREALAKGAA